MNWDDEIAFTKGKTYDFRRNKDNFREYLVTSDICREGEEHHMSTMYMLGYFLPFEEV